MANNTISLVGLDFDTFKSSLKTFLKNQDIFRDYDFDGSNMSVLLDILAYNTFNNAFYLNMVASEAFLDSAQLLSSIISHAKELNYLPRSTRSAKAVVSLEVEQSDQDYLVIPAGTPFTTTISSGSYTFYTDETKVFYTSLDANTGTYIFDTGDIDIYEGIYVTDSFIYDYSQENQRFILSNKNVDTRSITVVSIEENGSKRVTYNLSSSLLDLDENSKSFFLQGEGNGKYEIVFGDGVIGRKPKDLSVISVTYRASSGKAGNGALKFEIDRDITSDSSGRITVTTEEVSSGGAEAETPNSIKFNAPRHFQTQERAVTATDYEVLLQAAFPEINALSVYGGETLNPPKYGKVYIAVDISDVSGLPDSKKTEYYNFLKPRMALPIEPVFVEPTYLYWSVNTTVKYNLNITNLRSNEIKTLVTAAIVDYNLDNLNDFNKTLRYSRLINEIDDADDSIVSNETDVKIYKKTTPQLNASQNIDIDFGMALLDNISPTEPLHPITDLTTISSSTFTFAGEDATLEDDGDGNIRIVKIVGNNNVKIKNVGTVDYDTGVVQLIDFKPEGYSGSSFRIYARPANKDITPSKNDIFTLEVDEVDITVKTIRE